MMKLFQIVALLCFCSEAMCDGIVASHIRLQWDSDDKFKIVLSLYLDEASNFPDQSGRLAYLFKNDEHWKKNGTWLPFGFYALRKISSTKFPQDPPDCNAVTGKNILLEVYESALISINNYPQFSESGYIIAWNPISVRDEEDVNVLNTGSFQEWIFTCLPPLLKGASVKNSSPMLENLKLFSVCRGKFTTIPLKLTDEDGDQVKFRLSKPLGVVSPNSGSIQTADVIWASGYSDANQMGGDPLLNIDPDTGVMTVKPDKPGQYFLGLSIDEYREGKKIGTVNLYYTIVVVECEDSLDLNPHIYQDTTAVTTLTICQGSEVTLSSHQSFPDPQPDFQWTKNGKIIWGANTQGITIKEEGTYQLLTTHINGCPDSFDSETVHVIVASSGIAQMDSIPPICDVTVPPVALNATPFGGAFAGPGVVGNTFDPSMAGVGRHEVRYSMQGTAECPASASKREVVVSETPVLDPADVLYTSRGKSITIGVADSLNVVYRWTPPDYLNDATYANPTCTPSTGITYTVTATNAYGCMASRTVRIKITENILIPDAFTPNKDGINETWELKGIEEYPDCRVTIYNRWGEVIFHSVGYRNAFDGTVAGVSQMPGVYAYKIRLTENSPDLTGSLTLIR